MNTALSAPAATTDTDSSTVNGALPQAQQFDSASAVRSSESSDMASLDSGMTNEEKRAAIDRMARAQERAFLTWNATGCFAAAAAYSEARSTWERALMKWGRV